MDIFTRAETAGDHKKVREILINAFGQDGEADLVENLRKNRLFIPELSFVAKVAEVAEITQLNGELAGYLLLFPIKINAGDKSTDSLALAPVAVAPEKQGQGIGSELIRVALIKAKDHGHGSVIVLGHGSYYPRFGFRPASKWEIQAPFEVPDEAFMAIEIRDGALADAAGTVVYPEEFNEV
jgi:predicted N-acetyltransferase YhbS